MLSSAPDLRSERKTFTLSVLCNPQSRISSAMRVSFTTAVVPPRSADCQVNDMLSPMSVQPQDSILLNGEVRIASGIEAARTKYVNAKPFPHVVIDNFFSDQLLEPLLTEIAGMERAAWKKVENDSRERTVRMRSATELGPAGKNLLSVVHSAEFLYMLSEITGIWQLLPDPYLQGGGYAIMRRGDYFHVHADRSMAYDTGLTRRLAMIIFLNKAWRPEFEGKLEMWNSDASLCEATVEPLFNKTVIFEVKHPNYHGVPVPLACPPDRARQSFILYYHTVGIDGKANVKPHTSIFAPRSHGTNRVTFRTFMRDVTPPALTRVFRKLTTRDP